MSGVLSGIATDIGSILFSASRSIAGIIPDVTIREEGRDELEVTRHPVETGAAVTDHAYLRPRSVTLEYGFTDSALSTFSVTNLLQGDLPSFNLGNQRTRDIYDQFQFLQASVVPITVIGMKRIYPNMLIESLACTVDASNVNALFLTIRCRHVFLVSTQAATIPPMSQQAMPASTAGAVDMGQKQLVAVPAGQQQSLLRAFYGDLFGG